MSGLPKSDYAKIAQQARALARGFPPGHPERARLLGRAIRATQKLKASNRPGG